MTKNLKNYLISLIEVMGWFWIMNKVRAAFETIFTIDLPQLRWGIWVAWIIAGIWFIWRFRDGCFRRMDFWADENDRSW